MPAEITQAQTVSSNGLRPATEPPPLSCSDVKVDFGGVRALANVSLDVRRGEVVAIVGPNGAGKTTLLNAVNGFLKGALTGEVTIAGTRSTNFLPFQVSRLGVGRSFQQPRLIEEESALENVLCGAHVALESGRWWGVRGLRAARRAEEEAREQANRILRLLDLADYAELRVSDLPYGIRKLIDIGRAIASDPHLLLLDEPSSGLDEHEQLALAAILTSIHESSPGLAIVLVEHHMPIVRQVADRLVALQTGAVLLDGIPDEVMASREFKDALVGRTGPADDSER